MFSPLLPSLVSLWPPWASGSRTERGKLSRREQAGMSVTYFKRYRMEFDLRFCKVPTPTLPAEYRLLSWQPHHLGHHADVKYKSFRGSIDADVFQCFCEPDSCFQLMEEISARAGFLPEATWLVQYNDGSTPPHREMCGAIQGVRISATYGAIQNVGVTSFHRGLGIGTAMVTAALLGFQQQGLPKAYLEVTAQNKGAVRLYQRLGFRRTKTLYRAVELAYS